MKIAVYSDPRSAQSTQAEAQLIGRLTQERLDVIRLTGFDGPTLPALLDAMTDNDIVISLGGDGTLLRTASIIGSRQIPILGINSGRLGFMADVTMDNISKVIADLVARRYKVEQRTVLEVQASGETTLPQSVALNDIAILKQDLSSMISIRVDINGNYLNTYNADGLLVATPTGSTAYNLSVGGPLLCPEVASLVVSPIASHSLTARPVVIPDNWVIDIGVESRSGSFMLSVDGQSVGLSCDKSLTIRKARYMRPVVKLEGHDFFSTLRTKLFWGADKRQ